VPTYRQNAYFTCPQYAYSSCYCSGESGDPGDPREILIDDNGHLVGIRINKDDVENDPALLNQHAVNENDLRKTRQDAYQQLKANRPDKTTKGYGKCKRLWKVSICCPLITAQA
jgi:hypothetical protein